jgi:hypothetical protein
MITHRPNAFFLAALLAGSLFSQGAADTERTLSTEGIRFKLPSGWQWQSEIASNIAIKKDVKAKDQTHTITAEMVFQAEAFLEDSIANIEKKVEASKGDLRDLKKTRGQKFNGNNAVLVTFTRVRGEKQDQFEDERNYLFRRNNALYTWTERFHRSVASEANSSFNAARQAIVFTQKDMAKENAVRTWPDAGVKYNLPPDFDLNGKPGELEPGKQSILIHAVSAVTIKGDDFLVNVVLLAAKGDRSMDDLVKQRKDLIRDDFEDVKDLQVIEGESLRGEKTMGVTFVGVRIPEAKPDQPNAPKRKGNPARWSFWFVRHKGHIIEWREIVPPTPSPAVDAVIKKARDAITFL